jgi:hypothetical protein
LCKFWKRECSSRDIAAQIPACTPPCNHNTNTLPLHPPTSIIPADSDNLHTPRKQQQLACAINCPRPGRVRRRAYP